jgi:hypothetical protein
MKKLLALLLLFVVCSCGYAPATTEEPITITEILGRGDGYCKYYSRPKYSDILGSFNACFIDTCGKFNVGDSIKFVK